METAEKGEEKQKMSLVNPNKARRAERRREEIVNQLDNR
jgi:hypothetical protein